MRVLIVTLPFADYSKGERITDPELVDVLFQSHRGHVVPVEAHDEPVTVEEPIAEPEPDGAEVDQAEAESASESTPTRRKR